MNETKHDELDLEDYYRRFGPMVLRRCRRFLRDEDKALDAMQDVFVQLLRYQDRLRGEYPTSLLYKIATNVCLNRIRSERRKPEWQDEDFLAQTAKADPELVKLEGREILDRIFENEDESTRLIAVMYFVDEMTLKEIGSEMNLSISGVRKRILLLQERARAVKKKEVLE